VIPKSVGHDYSKDVRCPICSLQHERVSELVECMRGHAITDEKIVSRLTAVGLLHPGEDLTVLGAKPSSNTGLTPVP
jgi:hypothetical protein